MQEDSVEAKLKQLESTAREMGASEEEIKARRPDVLKSLMKRGGNDRGELSGDEQKALDEVRELTKQSEIKEASEFARRTGEEMTHHPETGEPLGKPQDEEE